MIEQVFSAGPVGSSFGQAFIDKVLSLLASFTLNARESNLKIDNRLVNGRSPNLIEGLLTRKYLESNAADCPDVDLFIMLFRIISIREFRSFIAS